MTVLVSSVVVVAAQVGCFEGLGLPHRREQSRNLKSFPILLELHYTYLSASIA